jgi:hypothetical protein
MKLRSGQNSHINCVCANNGIYPLYESRRFGRKITPLTKNEGEMLCAQGSRDADGHGIPATRH